MEIERKFLVKNDLWKNAILKSEDILQFYLTSLDQSPTVRLRVKGEKGYFTLKYPSRSDTILVREEYEYEIPKEDVLSQQIHAKSRIIRKTRHRVQGPDQHVWEVDEFHSPVSSLILAELELDHIEESFICPDWAGEDVTTDGQYSNIRISFDGL